MKFLFVICALFILQGASIALAVVTPPAPPGTITPPATAETVTLENPLEADNIIELFETIIDIVLIFAVPLIVFFIIYAGFLYVTARGNEGTIERAHKALLYALIGGLLILGARVLIDVVQGTVDCVRDLENECE
jgi:hypothetical protein